MRKSVGEREEDRDSKWERDRERMSERERERGIETVIRGKEKERE